jgi:hypothetical protein
MDPMMIAFSTFILAVIIGLFLYFRPQYIREGFATVALDNEVYPKCILRDIEAQQLLAEFQGYSVMSDNTSTGMAYNEFKLIIQKLLCIDADITGSGAGPYSTVNLPFATSHDIEPPTSFVGRCVRRAIRSQDLVTAIDKYESRGLTLLKTMCFDEKQRAVASRKFHSIVARVSRNISRACLTEKASLDTPAGIRDPGYYLPPQLQRLHDFKITGGIQWL